jgi:hypothetical protein
LLIGGHYYSDKTPAPAVFLAVLYQCWSLATGLTAHAWPAGFVYAMTLGSSVAAYALTLLAMASLVRRLGLPDRDVFLLTASLALATIAPIYALQVNNHILLLAAAALVLLAFTRLAEVGRDGRSSTWPLVGLGTGLGLGYAIDQGVGPMLVLAAAPLVPYRCRTARRCAVVALAACPWLVLHHALNYAIGGSWQPANANPEYFQWPGCPFTAQNMTGVCTHRDLADALSYTTKMLIGKQGFVGHDLALWLLPAAGWVIGRRRPQEWPEAAFALTWIVGTVGLYAWLSKNYGGECRSVRWFVPLLAPAYYLLALLVREAPRCRADLLILSGWGFLVIATRWQRGPWDMQVGDWYWPLGGAALTTWLAWNLSRLGSTLSRIRPGRLRFVRLVGTGE